MGIEDQGQFVTQQLLIPGQKCGLIIGKNGETIKNMQVCLKRNFSFFDYRNF